MAYSEPIARIISELGRLPGIGEKTAERLTFHLLAQPREDALRLAEAIRDLKDKVRHCSTCYNLSEQDPCALCSDPKRDRGMVCVVEQTRDLWAIEKSASYRGTYHVLHGHLSPIDGVGPEHLTVAKLVDRVKKGGVTEVILATNPTAEGDATAFYLQKQLGSAGVRVTRIARGLPAGGTIEYSSRATVGDALAGRKDFGS